MTTHKLSRKAELIIIFASMLLIVTVLGFTGGLNIASFKQNYTANLVSTYAVGGGETVRKIEYAVKYGKPLANFYGMEELLTGSLRNTPDVSLVQVVLPDGQVVYNQLGAVRSETLDAKLLEQWNGGTGGQGYTSVRYEGRYAIFMPIKDKDGAEAGKLALWFEEQVVQKAVQPYVNKLLFALSLSALCGLLALLLFMSRGKVFVEGGHIRKTRMIVGMLVILSLVQGAFCWVNYSLFSSAYADISRQTAELTTQIVRGDIQGVVSKGVPYEKLYGLGEYLQRVTHAVPAIERISLTDGGGRTLFSTAGDGAAGSVTNAPAEYRFNQALSQDQGGVAGQMEVLLSASYIQSKMRDIILDTVTVFVTSILFMVEIALFVTIMLRRSIRQETQKAAASEAPQAETAEDGETALIRPLAFVLFIGVFMGTSFIPVVMKKLYAPFLGLSREVTLALPVSAEMLFAGLATIAAGYMIDRRGWRNVFYLGLSFFAVGTLLSALAWSPGSFILARILAGAGYGFSLMSLRGCVNSAKDEKVRSGGVSGLFSGMYAGLNCGVIVGAMLADRIGFSSVFYVAFAVALVTAGLSWLFLRGVASQAPAAARAAEAQKEAANVAASSGADAKGAAAASGGRAKDASAAGEAAASAGGAKGAVVASDGKAEGASAAIQPSAAEGGAKGAAVASNGKTKGAAPAGAVAAGGAGSLKSFLVNRKVTLFFLLVLIPTAVCSMFLDYYFPVFAESAGISSSNIGRAFLLNGLCIVYLGPLLTRHLNGRFGVEKAIIVAGLLVVAAMSIFAIEGSIYAAFAAVILLGIADSFGLSAQNNYFVRLEATSHIGTGKALGYYGNIKKVGQMLGPIAFGGVAVLGTMGVGMIGGLLLAALALFVLSLRGDRQKAAAADRGMGA